MKAQTKKTVILITVFVIGIIFPISEWQSIITLIIYMIAALIAGFWAPYLMQMDLGMGSYTIQMPKWTDKINIKYPLVFAQLIEYILFAWGLGLIIGEVIQSAAISLLGLCLVMGGFGIRIGIHYVIPKSSIRK